MKINTYTPPATLGIVGGGQLGRMMAEAAKPLGYEVIILDPALDCSAGKIADRHIVAAYDDRQALNKLAKQADVLTYEFENVDVAGLENIAEFIDIPQGTELLEITSNRLYEKSFLKKLGLPVTEFTEVNGIENLIAASEKVGLPAILKTVSGGYDGHGQWDINDQSDIKRLIAEKEKFTGMQLILEKRLTFSQEISVMVTRDINGNIRIWPIAQNQHQNHILKISKINQNLPRQITETVQQCATQIAQVLDLRGVLGIEMFVVDQTIYINELAPRPHNSGHYSIEGCNVSQFEGHIRSVLGLPVPTVFQVDDEICMINLLGSQILTARNDLLYHPEWHFHDYEKNQVVPKRKMGHITVIGHQNCQSLLKWERKHHDID